MSFARVGDVNLYYEILGDRGPLVVLMSGGRSDHARLSEVNSRIAAAGYRVLAHDRRNCGISDMVIGGEDAEYEIWADDLHGLLLHLGEMQAVIAGASSGCRTAIVFALRHPEATRALMLLRITAGPFAAHHLAEEYYGAYIDAARKGGMEAVCELGHFKERIAAKPANREYLMGLEADRFVEAMSHWRDFYLQGADLPVLGATEQQLRSIDVPTLVIPGNDRTHPRQRAYDFAGILPRAEVHDVMGAQMDIVRTAPEVWDAKNGEIASIFVEFLKRLD
jgi:pimeloyl-ACP methyl ester carboxylesterase